MANEDKIGSAQPALGNFASTQWSIVVQAGGVRNSPDVEQAMSLLCSTYWYPLYVFIRRQGYSANEAEDLTQEFFTRFIDRDFLSNVDQNRGKFRTFLLACCQHFLANQRDHARAQKRGGGRATLTLDFPGAAERYSHEPASEETAEKVFLRRWALTLLDQALAQLHREYQAEGKTDLFNHLKTALVGATQAHSDTTIAAPLDMTPEAVRKAGQRLRQRYRKILREHIGATVDEPGAIEDEIRDLFAALAS